MRKIKKYYPNILVAMQFSIIGLMIIFTHNFCITPYPIMVFIIGLAFGIWALKHNQLGNFHIQPILRENCKLVTTGIYRYIRHPIYLSVIVMMLSIIIATPTIVEFLLFSLLIIVLLLKALKEESLWCGHNIEYQKYRKNSKLFINILKENSILIAKAIRWR